MNKRVFFQLSDSSEPSSPEPEIESVYMVETDNFVQQDFETSDELKAVTQEVIKTIRDIIVSQSLIILLLE